MKLTYVLTDIQYLSVYAPKPSEYMYVLFCARIFVYIYVSIFLCMLGSFDIG